MILVDQALAARAREARPIGVAMIGAGFMARGLAYQVARHRPGLALRHVVCRRPEQGAALCAQAGLPDHLVTQDWRAAVADPAVEVVVEVTGALDYGAAVVLEAIAQGKHVVLMNAELDGTVGPLLWRKARAAGLVYSGADGDQPVVQMNLWRFVEGLGLRPLLAGNIKGLQDPYRNPTTQQGFAERWGQNVHMVTSFADGSKISFEQAIVANARGLRVGRRGMFQPVVPEGTPISQAPGWYPAEAMLDGPGLVDYVVGAAPAPGVFVIAHSEEPLQRHYLNLYKLGEGPFYCFHTPYHLCHFEVPNTVARAALFHESALEPLAGPCVDVVATAKTDLPAGTRLDGLGGYHHYGQAENHAVCRREGLLPSGLAEGMVLRRAVRRDTVLTLDDVEQPEERLIVQLRAEMEAAFPVG